MRRKVNDVEHYLLSYSKKYNNKMNKNEFITKLRNPSTEMF